MSRYRWILAVLLVFGATAAAQDTPDSGEKKSKLTVGTKESPPFSFRGPDGEWTGISIDLWKTIADKRDLDFEFKEMQLPEMLKALKDGEIDAAVAAITVTAERERKIDFSHPIYNSGLGIAVGEGQARWAATLQRFVSLEFLTIIGGLVTVLLFVGFLVWLAERPNKEFADGGVKGIGAAFWWSAVTMTTVGYGDMAPKTLLGRLLAIIWMFAGIMLFSIITATISSTLTVSQLGAIIDGPEDLGRVTVATVGDTTSARYLDDRRIRYQVFDTVQEALDALQAKEVQAVVYDAPILKHLVLKRGGELKVLPTLFERQDYAIGLPHESERREPINHVILEHTSLPGWEATLNRYLGK